MAAESNVLIDYLENQNLSFENLIKKIINEPENVQIDNEILWSRLIKLSGTLVYWAREMTTILTQNRLILTVFDPGDSKRYDNTVIFKAINNIIDISHISELYYPKNTNFIGIEFNNIDVMNSVKQKLQMAENVYIVNLEWGLIPKKVNLRIHWLPSEVEYNKVTSFLDVYFQSHSIKKLRVKLIDNVYINSNIMEVQALLKDNGSIENIPYITTIDNHQALINIRGRPPICLNCMKTGHIRANCSFNYCRICRAQVPKQHSCKDYDQNVLFSDVVKQVNQNTSLQHVTLQNDNQNKQNMKDHNKQLPSDSCVMVNNHNKDKSVNIITYSVNKETYKRKQNKDPNINDNITRLQKIADSLDDANIKDNHNYQMDFSSSTQKRTHDQISDDDEKYNDNNISQLSDQISVELSSIEASPNPFEHLVIFSDTDS